MKVILFLVFLCSVNPLLAQNTKIDSLKEILRYSKEDTSKVKLLCDIAKEYYDIDLTQSSSYAKEGISLAEKLNWKKGEIMGGLCVMRNQETERQFSDAISSGIRMLRMAEAENDSSSLIQIYSRLGEAYRVMFQFTVSEEYHMKALLVARKYANELALLKVLVNLDAFYTLVNQYDKAEKYAAEALPIAIRLKQGHLELLIQQMNAERKYESGNIREAVTLYSWIIESRKATKQYHIVAHMEGRLGRFYADLHMKDSAYYFANAALELSKKEQLVKELNDSYEALYYVSTSFHDYENALKYHLVADTLEKAGFHSDVMIKAERERLLLQEKKDALANAEIQKQKTVRNFTFVVAIGLLAFGGYAFYNFRKRKKFERQQALSEERLRISRELHDDIGSTLGSIAVYSDVAKRRSAKDEVSEEALGKIGKASRELIEKMGDIIWNLNPENENFEQLLNRMQAFAAMILAPRNINVNFDFDESLKALALSPEHRKNLFLIFKESIHNIVKHAEANNVFITLRKENEVLKIRIKDDGKGFEMNNVQSVSLNGLGGNGLKSMTDRAKTMMASFNIISKENEGTTVDLSIKVL